MPPSGGGSFFVLRDAVHGDVYLTREEGRILDTRAMQRLRHVRQLGTAYLVYPGANHTRFEHSIGTLHVAQRMIDAIRRNHAIDPGRSRDVSPDETRVVRMAALLHDVTHIPQGHSIEDQTGLFARHDTPGRFLRVLGPNTELGALLSSFGVRDAVCGALMPPDHPSRAGVPVHLSQVFGDTICADLLDYLRRDAYHTGLTLTYDDRLVNYFHVDPETGNLCIELSKHGMLREDILSECLRMLEARYYFSERVYYHHAKIAAGALCAKAAEHAVGCGALKEDQFYDLSDDGLLDLLERAPIEDAAVRGRMRILLDAYRRRRLPKRVCIFPAYANRGIQDEILSRWFAPGRHRAREAKEREIETRVLAVTGREVLVLLYCPARRMQLQEARIHVRWPGETRVRPLRDYADRVPRLGDLERSYRDLWKFYAFAIPPDPRVLPAVQRVVLEALPGATNTFRLDGS